MDKQSEPYRSGDYSDFFEASERRNLAREERVEYSKSYYKMVDDQAALEYMRKEGFETGRQEGRAEGRAEGREQERFAMARKLLALGVDVDTIARASGLDLSVIEEICKESK